MRMALNEAQQAFDIDEVPIGAVIVMNNKIDFIFYVFKTKI